MRAHIPHGGPERSLAGGTIKAIRKTADASLNSDRLSDVLTEFGLNVVFQQTQNGTGANDRRLPRSQATSRTCGPAEREAAEVGPVHLMRNPAKTASSWC